jgi:hypothetical protein
LVEEVASLVDGEVALPVDGVAAPESVGVVDVVGLTGPGGMAAPLFDVDVELDAPAPVSAAAPLVVPVGAAAVESAAGAVAAASVCMVVLEALASMA